LCGLWSWGVGGVQRPVFRHPLGTDLALRFAATVDPSVPVPSFASWTVTLVIWNPQTLGSVRVPCEYEFTPPDVHEFVCHVAAAEQAGWPVGDVYAALEIVAPPLLGFSPNEMHNLLRAEAVKIRLDAPPPPVSLPPDLAGVPYIDFIGPVGPAGPPGPVGPVGPVGSAPLHQWDGTRVRFSFPGGGWGSYVDLVGPAGPPPAHEWFGSQLRFRNPDGSWGVYSDLLGPQGLPAPASQTPFAPTSTIAALNVQAAIEQVDGVFSGFGRTLVGSVNASAARSVLALGDAATFNRASKDQAEAGTSNDTLMTPLRVAEAIAALTSGIANILAGQMAPVTAGDAVVLKHCSGGGDDELVHSREGSGTSYRVLIAETALTATRSCSLRVAFEHASGSSHGLLAYAAVLRDGVVLQEWSTTSSAWAVRIFDVALAAGQTVCIRLGATGATQGGGEGEVINFTGVSKIRRVRYMGNQRSLIGL
jgi:hypothetical protein